MTEEIRKGWRENEARKAGGIAGAAARSSLQKDMTVHPHLHARHLLPLYPLTS